MKGHHLQIRGHGHGHHHFHARTLHMELDQAIHPEARDAINNATPEGTETGPRILPRVNNLDEKPVGGSMTIPIVLGVCIPLGVAFCVLMYLHYRTTVRQKKEDETDKYKSMDFGLEGASLPGKGTKRRSAFFGKEKEASHHKMQLSMDMNLSSPYLLPPNLQNSRESLNSLAKSLHQNEDPYRPVTSYISGDSPSRQSLPKGAERDSAISKGRPGPGGDAPQNQRSIPPGPLSPIPAAAQPPQIREPVQDVPDSAKNEFRFVNDASTVPRVPQIQEPPTAASRAASRAVPNSRSLTNEFNVARPLSDADSRASSPRTSNAPNVPPPRKDSLPAGSGFAEDYQDYTAHFQIDEPDNAPANNGGRQAQRESHVAGLGVPGQDNRRLSVGFRPLPPDDFLESEDPEFRANRIRSFYKEYFEETKVDHGKPPPLPAPQQATYYDEYGETAFFDPETNAFVMPYAQPVTRRAMTPPPSSRRPMPGPGPNGPRGHGPHGSMNMPGGPRARPRAGSAASGARWAAPSPRPSSSASNPRMLNNAKPRKPMPPPAALSTLPTPSKLRDDSFSILNAIDFAPPPTMKDHVAGRSQSPMGERKPYVLNAPIHSPLVSAFDDTPALPSPHLLRKSGTYTALDFAPPRRFKDAEAMSESGSVVSVRSGISSTNLSAIRGGAGRVSRLPGDTVFTQSAAGATLKPSWAMRD
ncbi:hypothetical protein GGS23DRAFT_566968 [Durotheca rogersii]|uniref:uncharacterized protein n=1 Tax=Durotheca rogersii TaxID=419775 RepID=UPI002220D0B3|nr:uncharacterized protein GGS23DRAFT_566968 [Durotheca rogersii]KAI5863429.1 hypothetical protein GGS23DRAFT_566968 [Durotheca rogersii]